jgi:alkanesulfonate monooxygenase SsuD/methylene tetrahydromethanopterin reductase-like flavin-dependent oxidoreductase (luciferase family)
MKVETALVAPSIDDVADAARRIESAGYDSVITPEAGHDPFLPLMIIAEHTKRLNFGTGVAIAFPRSPFVTAQIAWDLQRYSGGRFMLGLGRRLRVTTSGATQQRGRRRRGRVCANTSCA